MFFTSHSSRNRKSQFKGAPTHNGGPGALDFRDESPQHIVETLVFFPTRWGPYCMQFILVPRKSHAIFGGPGGQEHKWRSQTSKFFPASPLCLGAPLNLDVWLLPKKLEIINYMLRRPSLFLSTHKSALRACSFRPAEGPIACNFRGTGGPRIEFACYCQPLFQIPRKLTVSAGQRYFIEGRGLFAGPEKKK